MKKGIVSLLGIILIVSLISMISSADITLSKVQYYPGETLIVDISGVAGTINEENIGIYASGAAHETPVDEGIVKMDSKYKYYAILPTSAGVYSVKLSDVKDFSGNSLSIIKNITIVNTNNSYLSLSPGALVVSDDFEISVKAYNQLQTISVSLPALNFQENFELEAGEQREVYFSINDAEGYSNTAITINSYSLPIIISPVIKINDSIIPVNTTNQTINNSVNDTNVTIVLTNKTIKITKIIGLENEEINATLYSGKSYTFGLFLYSKNNTKIDVDISSESGYITINPSKIEDFNEDTQVNITINSKKAFNSTIVISALNQSIIIPVTINITENVSQISIPPATSGNYKTCSKLGGKICLSGESCSGTTQQAIEGSCCVVGSCVASSSSGGWLIGIIILIVLGIVGYVIYKKANQTPGKGLGNMFKKKTEDYNKRMSPPVEVHKGLSKI